MKWKKWLSVIFLCMSMSVLVTPMIEGGTKHRQTEDFFRKQYCDTTNTTAWWDTTAGELKLPPFELTLVGTADTPHIARRVAIAGDYAYIADHNTGVQVVDISDLSNPLLVGGYDTEGLAYDVEIAGDVAYVCINTSGFVTLSVETPATPVLLDSYSTAGPTYDAAIAGNYAYVACDYDGLQVMDISNPENISLAGSYDTPGQAWGVALAGNYAYVADWSSNTIQVIDISDPTNPDSTGSVTTLDRPFEITVEGNYAYVACRTAGLQIADISDPTNPFVVGGYVPPISTYYVSVDGNYAVISNLDDGIKLIDIGNPAAPSLLASYVTPAQARGVTIVGENVFVGVGAAGMQIFRIADYQTPALVGSYQTSGTIFGATGIALSGEYAYVADWQTGLHVVDVSDPSNPVLVGSYDLPGNTFRVTVDGDHAFVAGVESGLHIIDITDPENPDSVGSYDLPDSAWVVDVDGNHAYIAAHDAGLYVIDISDPANPTVAGSYKGSLSNIYDVEVAGDFAYLCQEYYGLRVMDISDPTNPNLAGSYATAFGYAWDVTIEGDYAFMAGGIEGLQVFDISNPSNPTLAGGYDTPVFALHVTICGDFAFVGDADSLVVLDITDPINPSSIDIYDTAGEVRECAIAGDYLFMANGVPGLLTMQIFDRDFISDQNIGQSLVLDQSERNIYSVKLNSVQNDSIQWEINPDNGGASKWQAVQQGNNWQLVTHTGSDLIWRSTHKYLGGGVNPLSSNLVIDWLYECAVIDSIVDVPDDQGKVAGIHWTRSGHDYAGSPTSITEYAIYRKIDPDLRAAPLSKIDCGLNKKDRPYYLYPPGDWDFITAIAADGSETYSTFVPTLKDSTVSEGMYYTIFFIRARTDAPGAYYDCDPDSGYTVDNLAPQSPGGFTVAYNTGSGNELTWESSPDADFQYFNTYRGTSVDFAPEPGNLEHQTIDTTWVDPAAGGWQYYYKITAVDFSGNESDPSSPETVTGAHETHTPKRFALHQNIPNPFNPSTTVKYSIASPGRVGLRVYDAAGRLVDILIDEWKSSGEYEVTWHGRDLNGSPAASGVYFIRLQSSGRTQTRKIVLMK